MGPFLAWNRRLRWSHRTQLRALHLGAGALLAAAAASRCQASRQEPLPGAVRTRSRVPVLRTPRRGQAREEVGISEIAANRICEDRYSVRRLGPCALGLAVFDGHGGYQVAEYLGEHMLPDLRTRLASASKTNGACLSHTSTWNSRDVTQSEKAMEESFEAIDAQLLDKVADGKLDADTGSCAICVVVGDSHLCVANSGDCQAMLVRAGQAVPLSRPHNAEEEYEQARLFAEHPGEEDLVKCLSTKELPDGTEKLYDCYVKGWLQPTRSFGDFHLKIKRFMPRKRRRATPPYITVQPEVETFERRKEDEMLILASDGLWERLTVDDVAEMFRSMPTGATPQDFADALLDQAQQRAADAAGMDREAMSKVPVKMRRQIHDDTTIIVVKLESFNR